MTEPTIRDVADQIRRELPDLMGSSAPAVEHDIDDRMRDGDEDGLFAVLVAHEPTRRRLDELLPQELEAGDRGGFSLLPGHSPEPSKPLVFACPMGDYEWLVFDVAEPVPPCPTHGSALVAMK
jgi:hypothetical protein